MNQNATHRFVKWLFYFDSFIPAAAANIKRLLTDPSQLTQEQEHPSPADYMMRAASAREMIRF